MLTPKHGGSGSYCYGVKRINDQRNTSALQPLTGPAKVISRYNIIQYGEHYLATPEHDIKRSREVQEASARRSKTALLARLTEMQIADKKRRGV